MPNETTTVPTPWWARVLVWLCLPAAGAGLLLLIVKVLTWIPVLGVLRRLPAGWATVAALAIGAIVGLVLAGLVDQESLTVRVGVGEVRLTRPGVRRSVPRGEIALAFRDRDQLVLLGRTGRELAREPSHVAARKLRDAFRAHGVAWADQDPYLDAYRRWVPGLSDVPADANAVFAARQRSLDRGDADDQRELREELGRLGFVVRDQRKRQYWRRVS